MSINVAFYPHILDLVLDALYADHDERTLRNIGLASPALDVPVQRKLHQHRAVHCRGKVPSPARALEDIVWNPRLVTARVLDVHDHTFEEAANIDEPQPVIVSDVGPGRPNTVRFFSRMHHRFQLRSDGFHTAIFNIDVPDSGFATVYPEDDLVIACPLPDVPMNILHLRYDQRGMGDFGFAFESAHSDGGRQEVVLDGKEHEVCVLMKKYDFGLRPKSPWRSTLLNQLAASALAYLHAHPQATLTLVGMDEWDLWCGSPFPDEEWEPTPARQFANKAEKVRYLWDWMFEHEFGRKYADIEDIKLRLRFEAEPEFRERIGEEMFMLVLQSPDLI